MSSNFANNGKARRQQADLSTKFFGKYDAVYVYGVSRVSTEEQDGLSPQTQKERMQWHCKALNWTLVDCFSDIKSAWHATRCMQREGLDRALDCAIAKMQACREKGLEVVAGVMTYDFQRFFRNTKWGIAWLDRLAENGAFLATVADGINTLNSGADARHIQRILLSSAEHQSDKTSERIKLVRQMIRKQTKSAEWPDGYDTMGVQPAGWMLDEKGARVPCEDELEILRKMEEAVRSVGKGAWYRAAKLLREQGVPTINAYRGYKTGLTWTPQMVQFRWRKLHPKKKRINRMDFVRNERPKLYKK